MSRASNHRPYTLAATATIAACVVVMCAGASPPLLVGIAFLALVTVGQYLVVKAVAVGNGCSWWRGLAITYGAVFGGFLHSLADASARQARSPGRPPKPKTVTCWNCGSVYDRERATGACPVCGRVPT